MKLKITLVAITCLAITSLKAQEISDTSFGKGLLNFVAKDSSFSVKFAPRFQVRSERTGYFSGSSGLCLCSLSTESGRSLAVGSSRDAQGKRYRYRREFGKKANPLVGLFGNRTNSV